MEGYVTKLFFLASVGAMTENTNERDFFLVGKKIVCRQIKPLLPT